MLTARSSDLAPQLFASEAGEVEFTDYFGSATTLMRGPQAYRSTFPPGYVIAPHFHRVDQFQIFVAGTATIGKRDLAPVSVHYADSLTPYGPIVVGDEPMAFFNLRSQADVGAHWMPGAKDEMGRGAGRAVTAHARLALDPESGPMRLETLIEPTDDGLLAYELVAGPNARLIDQVAGGSGRYQLVLEGTVALDGVTLEEDSVAFAAPGERLGSRRAGEGGVRLLELQLPAP